MAELIIVHYTALKGVAVWLLSRHIGTLAPIFSIWLAVNRCLHQLVKKIIDPAQGSFLFVPGLAPALTCQRHSQASTSADRRGRVLIRRHNEALQGKDANRRRDEQPINWFVRNPLSKLLPLLHHKTGKLQGPACDYKA